MASNDQPVPKVSEADVARIVERDFAPSTRDEVVVLLARYGNEDWQAEAPRVRLAVLKLADGDLDKLRPYVDAACQDFRDVLVDAEYPLYYAVSSRGKFARGERAATIAADWEQYLSWLHKPSRTQPQ